VAEVDGELLQAFPNAIRAEASEVLSALPEPRHQTSTSTIGRVLVEGAPVSIPSRIYYPELAPAASRLTVRQTAILNWLYTRHHDGHVREAALRRAGPPTETWMVPFATQLLGEYVIEILNVLNDTFTEECRGVVAQNLTENVPFLMLTRARMTSYWDCYYRFDFPNRQNYIGERLMKRLESWASPLSNA